MRIRCLLRGHEPISKVDPEPAWAVRWECFHCHRTLGTTQLVPSDRLLADLRVQVVQRRQKRSLRHWAKNQVARLSARR